MREGRRGGRGRKEEGRGEAIERAKNREIEKEDRRVTIQNRERK